MEHRGTEAPMDFTYDQPRTIDPNSPFRRFAALKRTHSDLQSPTPTPSLAPPNSEPFLFPRTSYQSPTPPTSSFRRATTTLRATPLDMSDFTDPDLFTTSTAAPKIFRGAPPSAPATPRGRTADGAITKLKRTPRAASVKARKPLLIEWDSDSDSDSDAPSPPSPPQTKSRWADNHRDVPLIISQYVQVFFNTSLALIFLYATLSAYMTVRHDVDEKLSQHSATLAAASNECARQFVVNRCAPDLRAPALQRECEAWEMCMNRDHTQVGKARLSAQTFAEIVESFVEPVSYRTMAFAMILGAGALFVPNFALGLYRARAVGHPAPILAAAAPLIAERLDYARVPSGGFEPQGTPRNGSGYEGQTQRRGFELQGTPRRFR